MFKKLNYTLFLLLFLCVSQAAELKALVGGTLIDGFSDQTIKNSVILIRGEKIEAIGQVGTFEIPADAEIISTEGMSVLPGLWDMHVHLMINGHADYGHWQSTYQNDFKDVVMPASAEQLLLAGVTSARDLGAPLEASIAVREAIERGEIKGPNLYVSGPFIQKEPYPGTEAYRWGVDGAKDARAKVKKLADAGVDVIKLIDQDQMTMAELKAVVDEAHKNGLPVVGHGHRPKEILLGLEVGVDNFEHTGLSTAPAYPDDVMAALKERAAQMNRGPLFWTPTIEGLFNYDYVKSNSEHLDNNSWHHGLPSHIINDIKQSIQHPERLPYFQITSKRKPTLKTKFKQLQEAGIVLLIGTDSGIPMKFHSQSTWNELDIWVREMGVSPMEAIRAATYWPSVMMKKDKEVGTITEGKYADIIAVKGDVLRYINLLQKVDMVFKKGERIK
ncbi:amidohydrolase family protein [Marinicella sp. W31]|uniref:amidohydrolase family protein n=1 Tax=Marinicella sp. W31 TaxID=3023713 RepID=UPI00375633BA